MTAISSITSGVSAADYANEPYAIQHGDKAAKSAYTEGLGLEQVFVDQLTQQLTATLGSGSSDSTDSSDGSSSDSSDSSDPSTSPYSSLLSSALTQGVMSSGGAGGLAMQLAASIDPSLALHTTK